VELNLAAIHETLAASLTDEACLVWRDRSWTWSDVTDRTRRFANLLTSRGLGRHGSLHACAGWESPHDHVALYATNSNAYLEAMVGAAKAGAVAVNVNYRYGPEELAYVLADARAAAVVYHRTFSATLAAALPLLAHRPLLICVDDGTDHPLLEGALDYEDALAAASPARPDVAWRGDDLYILYTGGTTGQPKGVLWRQADFLVAALGVRAPDGREIAHLDQLVHAARRRRLVALPAPPFMHGAAHWNALSCWINGGTVVIQDHTDHFDPADVLDTCERHRVTSLLIVGDAFARPLADELAERPRDLAALRHLLTGGAILSPSVQADLLGLLPGLHIVDVLGSSETGRQAVATTSAERPGGAGRFVPAATAAVLSEDRSRVIAPDDGTVGWLGQGGRVPRGYLGDPEKTAATFPRIDGTTWAVAGDRARWRPDGSIELLGRESVTINTGGEKVFAEEVEQALKAHPAVFDVLVVGRPSERWGQEVTAVVAVRPGRTVTLEDLREVGGRHLARYKLPRVLLTVDAVQRSPSGKPDYAWARELVASPT
jgi:fatty-acyl-CoA synthase